MRRHFPFNSFLFAFLVAFALLVSDAARGLASRLAGGLAFAAAAVLCAFAKVTSFDGFDMFHNKYPPNFYSINYTTNIQASQHFISKNLLFGFILAVLCASWHMAVLWAGVFAADADNKRDNCRNKRCADEEIDQYSVKADAVFGLFYRFVL